MFLTCIYFIETEIHLPRYVPKQYSSFAEFRSSLQKHKKTSAASVKEAEQVVIEPQPSTSTADDLPILDGESRPKIVLSKSRFQLPENLPPPRLLAATDEDIIDLSKLSQ